MARNQAVIIVIMSCILSSSVIWKQSCRFAAAFTPTARSRQIMRKPSFVRLASATTDQNNDNSNAEGVTFQKNYTDTAGASVIQGSYAPAQPTALASSAMLAIEPSDVEIVSMNETKQEDSLPPDMLRQLPFVNMFRGSANYIANHRNTLAVYHIPGGLLDLPDPNVFRDLMNDIALTWLLGMKIVIVVGCRHQIEKRIGSPNECQGLRVTDQDTLRVVKEEAGYVRFEVERQLARSLRVQGAAQAIDGNVVSGNFFSAQPFGILDGIDYQ